MRLIAGLAMIMTGMIMFSGCSKQSETKNPPPDMQPAAPAVSPEATGTEPKKTDESQDSSEEGQAPDGLAYDVSGVQAPNKQVQ